MLYRTLNLQKQFGLFTGNKIINRQFLEAPVIQLVLQIYELNK